MCFSVPLKVIKIGQSAAIVEGGKSIKIDKNMILKREDYLLVAGNISVGKMSKTEGIKVRKLIKSLSS